MRRGAGEGLQGRPSSAGKGNRGKEAEGQERREFGRETMQAGEKRKEGRETEREGFKRQVDGCVGGGGCQ